MSNFLIGVEGDIQAVHLPHIRFKKKKNLKQNMNKKGT